LQNDSFMKYFDFLYIVHKCDRRQLFHMEQNVSFWSAVDYMGVLLGGSDKEKFFFLHSFKNFIFQRYSTLLHQNICV